MAGNERLTPGLSWGVAAVVAGTVVAVALVAISPKEQSVVPVASKVEPAPAEPAPAAVTPAEPAPADPAPVATAAAKPEPETMVQPEPAPKIVLAEPAPQEKVPETSNTADPAPVEPVGNSAPTEIAAGEAAPPTPAPQTEVVAEQPEPIPAPTTPSFDTVRVDPDGAALVAGQAEPGAKVALMVEGAAMAEVTADAAGNFVAMFDLPADAQPRLLSLQTTDPAGRKSQSANSVAIAPIAAPVVEVAEAVAPTLTAKAPAALVISPEGARPAQPALASSPVTIDTFSFDASGVARLAGRGAAGAKVRLYVDNADAGLVTVGEDGLWQADVPGVPSGEHSLRADQIGADGAVLARVEQPITREAEPEPEPVAPDPEPAPEPAPESPQPEAQVALDTTPPAPLTITVKPGYSLWRIADEQFGDGVLYVQLFEANKDQIRDPNLIYPGQVFSIPAP